MRITFILLCVIVFAGCTKQSPRGVEHAVEPERTTLPSWGNGSPSLTLVLPKGFSHKLRKGPDFDVHELRHPDDIGVLSIYEGCNPNRKPVEAPEKILKKFGGQVVEFEKQKTDYGSFADAIILDFFKEDSGPGVKDLMIHVMIHAKNEMFYDEVWPVLESVAKAKRIGEQDVPADR